MAVFQDRKTQSYIDNFVKGDVSLPKCELYFNSALGGDISLELKKYFHLRHKFFKEVFKDGKNKQYFMDYRTSVKHIRTIPAFVWKKGRGVLPNS